MKSPLAVSPRLRRFAVGLIAIGTGLRRVAARLTFAGACSGLLASVASAQTYYGPSIAIGSGSIRSYVELKAGVPSRIGVQLDQNALIAFSTSPQRNILLSLPAQAPAPYNHLAVGWIPAGHPGQGYNVPHFDFHFYFSPPEQVGAIPFSPAPSPVNPAYVAPFYATDGLVIAQMGGHYVDLLAPEYQPGGKLTQTFIYGYYKGQMTFLEPMIALDYLAAGGTRVVPVRQPSTFAIAGYYPTEYGFSTQDSIYSIFIGGLTETPLPGTGMVNLSVRGRAGSGDDTLITGFVIGARSRTVLIRGVGPALATFGVSGALADPTVTVFDSKGTLVAQNDNWSSGGATATAVLTAAAQKTGAFTLTANSLEAALLATLVPGAYSVHVRGATSASGIALIEVYEVP